MEDTLAAISSFFNYLIKTGSLGAFATLLIGLGGFVVQHWIAVRNDSRMRKRELDKELRDAYLTFYDPLLDVLKALAEYLETPAARKANLSAYDPEKSACRTKLRIVAEYCKNIREVYGSFRSPLSIQDAEIASFLSIIRQWTMHILFLREEKEFLCARIPSDDEVLHAIEELSTILEEEIKTLLTTSK